MGDGGGVRGSVKLSMASRAPGTQGREAPEVETASADIRHSSQTSVSRRKDTPWEPQRDSSVPPPSLHSFHLSFLPPPSLLPPSFSCYCQYFDLIVSLNIFSFYSPICIHLTLYLQITILLLFICIPFISLFKNILTILLVVFCCCF